MLAQGLHSLGSVTRRVVTVTSPRNTDALVDKSIDEVVQVGKSEDAVARGDAAVDACSTGDVMLPYHTHHTHSIHGGNPVDGDDVGNFIRAVVMDASIAVHSGA